jgi:hypothetical protein
VAAHANSVPLPPDPDAAAEVLAATLNRIAEATERIAEELENRPVRAEE